MTSIRVDITALAKLARLEVSKEELTRLEKEIPRILEFVETIQAVSAQEGGESKESSELHNVMRADENPHESGIYTEKLLEAAPARKENRIVVKQVISRKSAQGGSASGRK